MLESQGDLLQNTLHDSGPRSTVAVADTFIVGGEPVRPEDGFKRDQPIKLVCQDLNKNNCSPKSLL